ncbi:MAG: hypothetical protein ACP5LH_02500 [Candidatus Micrarchaeia archaeon]
MKKEKLKMILSSLFVVIIFLSAYAAFGNPTAAPNKANNSSNITNNSKVKTFLLSESINGILSGYPNSVGLNINLSKVNNISSRAELSSIVGNELANMMSSNEISEYQEASTNGTLYTILLSNMSAYQFQQTIIGDVKNALNSSNIINKTSIINTINSIIIVNSTAYVMLPSNITFGAGLQSIKIKPPITSKSISIAPLLPIGTNIPLTVLTVVDQYGNIYNNNFKVSYI